MIVLTFEHEPEASGIEPMISGSIEARLTCWARADGISGSADETGDRQRLVLRSQAEVVAGIRDRGRRTRS